MRVLLVEDSAQTVSFVVEGLVARDHDIAAVGTVSAACEAVQQARFDVLLVDRMLPDGDGLALVKSLRENGTTTPVLFLTAMGLVEDRVAGFESGGDDYLVKPFSIAELVARVEALGRRVAAAPLARLALADLVLDRITREVRRGVLPISLQLREFELLEALLEASPDVLSRTMLLEKVWRIRFDPGTNLIESHISRLRAKIDLPGRDPLIRTVRGVGYAARA
ncbi:MAG: response regulator transcription factor [Sphingomonadales bacterium]